MDQHQGHKELLQFFIDKDGGITLNDCEIVTEKVDAILTMENLVDCAYILEVSSPGPKRVLKKAEHFKKFIGSRARIYLKVPLENRGCFTGLIASAEDKSFVLDDGTNKFTFAYEDIKKANLAPESDF